MLEHDLKMYEEETTITYTSFSKYQIDKVDPMLLCADIGSPHSCIGDKALQRFVRYSGRRSIPIIDSKRDFEFGDTLIRSIGMVELKLLTSRSKLGIPVILDIVEV